MEIKQHGSVPGAKQCERAEQGMHRQGRAGEGRKAKPRAKQGTAGRTHLQQLGQLDLQVAGVGPNAQRQQGAVHV